jgi:adenine phosphoribosyltransferase
MIHFLDDNGYLYTQKKYRHMNYKDALKFYPDFPIKGVNFVDVIPFLQDRELLRGVARDLGVLCASPNVAAPEARGFLFATPMMVECANIANIIPIRKKGKLPYAGDDLVGVDIVKEYGKDEVFFRLSDVAAGRPNGDTFEVTFFDDILATGGTAKGLAEEFERQRVIVDGKEYKVKITDFVFLVEITDLPGREILEPIAPVKSLIKVTEG